MFSRFINALRPRVSRLYDADIVDRINRIDWFARCGQPFGGEFPMATRRVATWSDAETNSLSQIWEDAELEFHNHLSVFLHLNAHTEYQQWNSVVDRAKSDVIGPIEHKVWRPMLLRHGLNEKVVASLQWDLLGALLENAYRDIEGRPTFFLHLLEIYEAGHFPCGWEGSLDPLQGRVLVL